MRLGMLGAVAVPMMLLAQCAPDGCAPAPPAPPASFGAGTLIVGTDVQPGIYHTTSTDSCYWERSSGLGGTLNEIIANDFTNDPAHHIVEIKSTDVAFSSERCGRWVLSGPRPQAGPFGDGDWAVNVDLSPGRWASDPTATGCYWERASGFTHESSERIANDFLDGRAVVDIAPTDVRFTSSGCGTWTPYAP